MGSLSYTIVVILHTSKVMLKILQARFQQYVNRELPDVQTGFRKGRGTRDQIANIYWVIEKAKEFQKNIYFCFIDYAKAKFACYPRCFLTSYFSNPESWCCESAALNMPANLENSAVATGLEKLSFHSTPKNAQTTAPLHSSQMLVK